MGQIKNIEFKQVALLKNQLNKLEAELYYLSLEELTDENISKRTDLEHLIMGIEQDIEDIVNIENRNPHK